VRAGVFRGPGTIQILEVDDPHCGEGEVVIAVAQCGVCGTDRSIFRGEYSVSTPLILGHEYSGTVVEIGNEVVGFAIGDRVVVDPNVVDDTCFFCRRGLSHLCVGLSPLGVARSGGFAELSAVPARYLYKIPDGVSLSEASLIEPLACCIRGIDQAAVSAGDVVVVLGAGPIGCFLIQLARMSGAAVVISVDPAKSRHDFASRAGADFVCHPFETQKVLRDFRGSVGADVVIEASGRLEAATGCFELVRRGGTVLLFGVYPQGQTVPISAFQINEDELRVVGSLNNPSTHSRAIDLISSGRLRTDDVVSDRLPLAELAIAMNLDNFANPGKIAIELPELSGPR
jgi:2-desacetyl-2-hydroxyethyl bacteriochlorophyllide A dehydrogenase